MPITTARFLPAFTLGVLLPYAAASAQTDGAASFRPPPATDAEWRCEVPGKGCVCMRPKRPDSPAWYARLVPGGTDLKRAVDALTEQACETAALARLIIEAPPARGDAPASETMPLYPPPMARAPRTDPRDVAEAHLAGRMIYTNRSDITPDGKAAEVRVVVAGKPCTVSLVRDREEWPWRVSAAVCAGDAP